MFKGKLFSYYDLLTFLKGGITFKKVCYHKFKKDIMYIYSEGNYIIENKENINNYFSFFLSDNANDDLKFEENITIEEK